MKKFTDEMKNLLMKFRLIDFERFPLGVLLDVSQENIRSIAKNAMQTRVIERLEENLREK